jgi:hypothetical protein
MSLYKVLLNAENVHFLVNGEPRHGGFFVTRIVEATTEDEAVAMARAYVERSEEYRRAILQADSSAPVMIADEVTLVPPDDQALHHDTSFIFY